MFDVNVSSQVLTAEAAVRILNSKSTVNSVGTVETTGRVSDKTFSYEGSGNSYQIANFPLRTLQQELAARFLAQEGKLTEAANKGLSVNISASEAEVLRTNYKVSFELEEVELTTKRESFSYSINPSTGLVEQSVVPTGTPYKTLQIVAKSIRGVKAPKAAVTTGYVFAVPAEVSAPVITKSKVNAAEAIAAFEG